MFNKNRRRYFMEKWVDFVWQALFGLLIVFFGGWILGGMLNFAALASPQLVSAMFCPAGSTAIREATVDRSSPEGSAILCVTRSGASVPNLSEDDSRVLQRAYFFAPSDIIMIVLVVGWFTRRRKRN